MDIFSWLLFRGIFLILFGILAIFWPGLTILTFAYLFALFIIFSGTANILTSVIDKRAYWILILLWGVIEVLVGIYAFNNIFINLAILAVVIGFTFILRGVLELIIAFDERLAGPFQTFLILMGILGVIAGIIIVRYPVTGALALTWVIGAYAIAAGAISVMASRRKPIRKSSKKKKR